MTHAPCAGFSVYAITNRADGRVYIGITSGCLTARLRGHLSAARHGHGSRLGAAIREHGESAFSIEKLAAAGDWRELGKLEESLIQQRRSAEPEFGYNSLPGGRSVRPNLEFKLRSIRCVCVPVDRDTTVGISTLSRNIRACRHAMGLTQGEVAKRAGLTPGHVYKLESGSASDPRLGTLKALAVVFGTTVGRLVGDVEPDTASHFHGPKHDTVADFY